MPIGTCKWGGEPFEYVRKGRNTPKGCAFHYHERSKAATDALSSLIEPKGGYAEPVTVPPKHQHPKGWEPRVEVDGDTGVLVSAVTDNADPERDALLSGSDLNPHEWEIVGDLSFNKWQGMVPVEADSSDCKCDVRQNVKHHEMRWQYQYKAKLRRYCPKKRAEIEGLIAEIRAHVPVPFAPPRGDDATVVMISDTQAGKSDGDGSRGMVGRFLRSIDAFEDRVDWLRFKGRARGPLYILGLGDLIENCDGHYPMQAYNVDHHLLDQVNMMRRLILKAIERWAPLFERVVIAAVPGNHGENRKDGKAFTAFGDNHDLAIFHQMEDALAYNPAAYGHVSFKIPKDDLALTLDVCGEVVGITHGHITGKARSSVSKQISEASTSAKKVMDWWAAQAHGQQPIGDARILFTGHYHHLLVTESGRKTHIQVPAMDGGSDWWRNLSGQDARSGMLSVRVGSNVSESGWADLEVL